LAPSPVSLRSRVHPLISFGSPSEFVASRSRSPDRSRVSSSPRGLRPLRDISTRSPLTGGFSHHLRSARSVSHALDGLLLLLPCGFVSPRCHVLDASPGVSPISQPLWFITSASRLVVSRHSSTGEQARLRRLLSPRLHGFTSGCWSVATDRCFTPACNSIPS
jgi:hypothetical protein